MKNTMTLGAMLTLAALINMGCATSTCNAQQVQQPASTEVTPGTFGESDDNQSGTPCDNCGGTTTTKTYAPAYTPQQIAPTPVVVIPPLSQCNFYRVYEGYDYYWY